MSWLNTMKKAGNIIRSKADSMLTEAENNTPNLESTPGWFGSGRSYADNETNPRHLKQGDRIVAQSTDDGRTVEGTVFSNDKRNELVTLFAENNADMATVFWYEAKFFLASDFQKKTTIKHEDMEDGVIYDAEIIE